MKKKVKKVTAFLVLAFKGRSDNKQMKIYLVLHNDKFCEEKESMLSG